MAADELGDLERCEQAVRQLGVRCWWSFVVRLGG
jgi:hypothetical protein